MMHAFLHEQSLSSARIPQVNGWVFCLQADNTSALSWIRHLSRTREEHLTQLCHLYSHMTFSFNSFAPSRFDGQHLARKLNVIADALLRPQLYPSYNKIFSTFPETQLVPAYRLPPALTSAINACLRKCSTKATLNAVTEALSTSRLPSFRLGAKNWASATLH